MQITQSVVDNAFNVVRCINGWVYVGGVFSTFNVERFTQNIVRFPADDVFAIDTMNGGVSGRNTLMCVYVFLVFCLWVHRYARVLRAFVLIVFLGVVNDIVEYRG